MTDSQTIAAIRAAKRKLTEAERVKCTCSSFCLQYEGGCLCQRGQAIKAAKRELKKIVDSIKAQPKAA